VSCRLRDQLVEADNLEDTDTWGETATVGARTGRVRGGEEHRLCESAAARAQVVRVRDDDHGLGEFLAVGRGTYWVRSRREQVSARCGARCGIEPKSISFDSIWGSGRGFVGPSLRGVTGFCRLAAESILIGK